MNGIRSVRITVDVTSRKGISYFPHTEETSSCNIGCLLWAGLTNQPRNFEAHGGVCAICTKDRKRHSQSRPVPGSSYCIHGERSHCCPSGSIT